MSGILCFFTVFQNAQGHIIFGLNETKNHEPFVWISKSSYSRYYHYIHKVGDRVPNILFLSQERNFSRIYAFQGARMLI